MLNENLFDSCQYVCRTAEQITGCQTEKNVNLCQTCTHANVTYRRKVVTLCRVTCMEIQRNPTESFKTILKTLEKLFSCYVLVN